MPLSLTRQKMLADLAVAFGGRLAEEIVFGHDKVTTGAQSDIEQATRMARAMVTRFGMSDKPGSDRLCRKPGRSVPGP